MTTADESDQQPGTPVVHLSRRAALEAERAAAKRKPARERRNRAVATTSTPAPATRSTPASAPSVPASAVPAPAAPARQRRTGRTAVTARATTEHAEARIRRVPRAAVAAAPSTGKPSRASRLNPLRRDNRTSRITLTSAVAAFVMFAASAMPAHAASGTSVATSTLAPVVRGQDYSVAQAVAATAIERDEFTVGGGSSGTVAGASVSYGGEVRSPFPGPVKMSSGFGYRSAPCGACSSLHQGLDFTPGMGTPIGAVAKGTVRVSGTYFSYGNAVIIDHVVDGRKVATLYGHMIPGSSPLKAGDEVEAGQLVGLVGSSGVSTGAHLHLEVLMDGVTPIDPEAWLEARIGRSLTT
uniref:M23 family metallopeptidase n=1 Tax=Neobacillus citreus TaxID=2833578 RepID=A0A942SX03_9BACI